MVFEGWSGKPWHQYDQGVEGVTAACKAGIDPFVISYSAPDSSECKASCDAFLKGWDGKGGAHIQSPTDGSDGWGAWVQKFS
jgi:hypothetical protein